MTLYLVTLEACQKRYTAQWRDWWKTELSKLKIKFIEVNGNEKNTNPDMIIKEGRFLDITKTNKWKAWQVINLSKLIESGKITDGDKILFTDGWHPGIINLKYMLDLKGIKADIYSIWHAGTYDKYDFTAQVGMDKWARGFEQSVFLACKKIFVATNYHKEIIFRLFPAIKKNNIVVTGLPFYLKEITKGYNIKNKENIVVFPHRTDPEKCPEFFDKLALSLPEYEFIKTIEITKNKIEYYNILSKAKIVFSANLQETWGIGTIEGLAFGCIPIVPDRLSYCEMYPEDFRYTETSSKMEIINKIKYYIDYYSCDKIVNLRKKVLDKLDKKYSAAISRICEEMKINR